MNDFHDEQVTLHRGIAAGTSGVALFPRQAQSGLERGLEPVFGASTAEQAQAIHRGTHDALPMIALDDILRAHPRIHLLQIDIQGGEADLIAACLQPLKQCVSYMVVGTHSRQSVPFVTVDGVQGWRNPTLVDDRADKPAG
jgi:hypothetical protein